MSYLMEQIINKKKIQLWTSSEKPLNYSKFRILTETNIWHLLKFSQHTMENSIIIQQINCAQHPRNKPNFPRAINQKPPAVFSKAHLITLSLSILVRCSWRAAADDVELGDGGRLRERAGAAVAQQAQRDPPRRPRLPAGRPQRQPAAQGPLAIQSRWVLSALFFFRFFSSIVEIDRAGTSAVILFPEISLCRHYWLNSFHKFTFHHIILSSDVDGGLNCSKRKWARR